MPACRTLAAERIVAVKQASDHGASSYAIGLSHRHVQRIVNGEYDHLLPTIERAEEGA